MEEMPLPNILEVLSLCIIAIIPGMEEVSLPLFGRDLLGCDAV
jgi:hypothetical protein